MNTQVWFFVFYLVRAIVATLMAAMGARAILSWLVMLMPEGGTISRLYGFLQMLTEPIIWPVRKLFAFFGWGEDFLIDLPFMVTLFLLMFVGSSLMLI